MKKMKKAIICILSLALCSALFSPLLPRMVSAAESEAPSITVAGSVPDETTPDESTQVILLMPKVQSPMISMKASKTGNAAKRI